MGCRKSNCTASSTTTDVATILRSASYQTSSRAWKAHRNYAQLSSDDGIMTRSVEERQQKWLYHSGFQLSRIFVTQVLRVLFETSEEEARLTMRTVCLSSQGIGPTGAKALVRYSSSSSRRMITQFSVTQEKFDSDVFVQFVSNRYCRTAAFRVLLSYEYECCQARLITLLVISG